jgi:hypothetical protein
MSHMNFCKLAASLFTLVAAFQVTVQAGTRPISTIPTVSQLAELKGSDATYLSNLGYSVAVNGTTVVVGAPGGNDGQGNFTDGAAYVFLKPVNGWQNMTQVAKLTASDNGGSNGFGLSVAISGNTIAVNSNLPEIYVFTEPVGGWVNMTETAILTAPSTGLGPCLCGHLAIQNDTVIVGSPLDALGNYGSIEVYIKPKGGWQNLSQPNATLSQSNAQFEDQSFRSVAISGGTIVGEGLVQGNTSEYSIFLFIKPAAGWSGNLTEAAVLSSTQAGNDFGSGGVAVSGNTVIAGSNSSNITFFPPSFVDVWVEPAGGWANMTETAQLSDGTTTYADGFGASVAIVSNTVAVGAPSAYVLKSGKAYRGAAFVFTEPAGGWKTTATPNSRLFNSDWTSNDAFGTSVSMSGANIVVGAPYGPNGSLNGEAYVFKK